MIHEVFMPALSSTMTEGKVVSWLKSPGDKVEKGETVVVVESDKADMDVESFHEGYLGTIVVPAGETAPVGAAIALIAETADEIDQAQKQAESQAKPAATDTPPPKPDSEPPVMAVVSDAAPANRGNGRVVASPRAKKLAKQLGVDLATVQGSGPHNRIVAEDVTAASTGTQALVPRPSTSIATPTPPSPELVAAPALVKTPIAPGQVVPLNTLQMAVVRNMVASLQVPVFRVSYTITTDKLDQLYKRVKPKGVTMTALLAKAVALTLQQHPTLNASYTEQGIHHPSGIHVAVAVAMDDGGLITPVLRHADQVDLYSLSRTWQDLVDRARRKQLKPEEYDSGTFTLSNLGMFGVERFDAILPPSQGAILAIGASQERVVAMEGLMGIRRQMQVNMTCDHRVIYGVHGAAFLQDLAKRIETEPQSLTL